MVDITEKHTTLRYAKAQAILKVSSEATIDAVVNKTVPKGDVLEFAKVAGLFAVKKTAEMIPDCHPLPIEYTKVSYEIVGLEIKIFVELKCIYRTGVEVEAMHGASVVALTMYDMLKPIDKGIEICNIKLVEKTGGKSDQKITDKTYIAHLLIFSNSVASGKKDDKISEELATLLSKQNINLKTINVVAENTGFVADFLSNINETNQLILIAGGTGITNKDTLPKYLQSRFEVPANSLMEAARQYGFERDPKAALSSGVAGIINNCLVINIPGSKEGAIQTVKPIVSQVRKVLVNMEFM
jgi:cyclic pyranopterin monophosphate synthase